MQLAIHRARLELVRGDLTDQAVDALVNAANAELAGGGGVDGAIHRRGGPSILAETRRAHPRGCATGDAVLSGAGLLRAKHVVHAVAPVWHGGQHGEPELLARAYRRSLEVAAAAGCRSVALPSLGTGAYGYPLELAAPLAVRTVARFLATDATLELVRFVVLHDEAWRAFAAAFERQAAEPAG